MSRYSSNKYEAKTIDADGVVHYSKNEHAIWSKLYQVQIRLANRYMVNEYIEGLPQINLTSSRIPQCSDITEKLKIMTGWQIKPVPALIEYKPFFEMLSKKTFPAATFIRDKDDFGYVTEPDIFHEIIGHAPLLANEKVAEFSQRIGLIGTQLKDHQLSSLARLYWFTIEFGLVKDKAGVIKPMGAALASSSTEMEYAATSEIPERRPFDIIDVLTTPYKFGINQPIYFVLDSFDHLLEILDKDLINNINLAISLGLQEPHPSLLQAHNYY